MKAEGVLVFADGPFAGSKEWLDGFVIDVRTEEQARYGAAGSRRDAAGRH